MMPPTVAEERIQQYFHPIWRRKQMFLFEPGSLLPQPDYIR